MKKNVKKMNAQKLIDKLEKIKTKYLNQHKKEKTMSYFKMIIEELQKISTIADIQNTITILDELEKKCIKNKKNYPNSKIMSIISLFTTTKSFLQYQIDNHVLEDFSKIHSYNFDSLVSTKRDEIVLLDITNIITMSRLTKSIDLNDLNNLNLEKEIRKKIEEMYIELDNLNKNKKKEISAIKTKYWYSILKFFSCGLWESSKIKKINQEYVTNANKKVTHLQALIKELETESYITKINADKKWNSVNDLSTVTKKETRPHTLRI